MSLVSTADPALSQDVEANKQEENPVRLSASSAASAALTNNIEHSDSGSECSSDESYDINTEPVENDECEQHDEWKVMVPNDYCLDNDIIAIANNIGNEKDYFPIATPSTTPIEGELNDRTSILNIQKLIEKLELLKNNDS